MSNWHNRCELIQHLAQLLVLATAQLSANQPLERLRRKQALRRLARHRRAAQVLCPL
jgi:hypothetical protein